MKTLVVSYSQAKELLPMRECIDVMADALSALARGDAEMPLRTIFRPQDVHGVMAMMPSFRRGNVPLFGLKAICVFPDNAAMGKDAHQGGVLLFSGETGELLAIVNASAITEIRTAAVSAVATRALARELGSHKINVNTLAPGFVLSDSILESGTHSEAVQNAVVQSRAFKRQAHPQDLLGALVFLASSDSDFTLLAIRIRESGFAVYGFGEEKTPAPYRSACDAFYRLGEEPPPRPPKPAKEQPVAAEKPAASSPHRAATVPSQPPASPAKVTVAASGRGATAAPLAAAGKLPVPSAEILASIAESANADGWAALSTVRQKLGKRLPNFNIRNHGYRKFSDLVAAIDGIEKHEAKSVGGSTAISVRRRSPPPPA